MTGTRIARSRRLTVVTSLLLMFSAASLHAATLWDESVNGDLTNNQAAPNPFTLSLGTNAVIGSLRTSSAGDNQDWIALTVPVGLQLSAVVLKSYSSADAQGFTGVQAGTNFVGNPGLASPYLGYAHFGTGAVNGALSATNLVGVNILPIMGDTTLAAGSQGFTPPLGSGAYTFLIQQTGPTATSYEFDYVTTAVPEPSTLLLMSFGTVLLLAAAKYRKRWSAAA